MKKRKFTRFICLLIVCTLIFSIPVSSTTSDIVEAGSKISDDLQEVMNNSGDTDLIDIYFSIKTLDIDSLKNKLSSIYKFDYDEYQDPESCKELLVSEVLAELKVSSLYSSIFKDISFEDYKTMNATESTVDFAMLDKINEWVSQKVDLYRKAKVEIYKEYYDSVRDYIKNKYEGESYEEVERFGVVSVTRARATIETITKIANNPLVDFVDSHKYTTAVPLTSVSSIQIGADSSTGTKSVLYNSPYNGNNVKIGVIEATEKDDKNSYYGRFDPSNKQLQSAINEGRLHFVRNRAFYPSVNEHATLVVSEIIGEKISIIAPDGRIHVFEGIVPKSTVYQTSFNDLDTFSSAIEMLIEEYNVSVINLSAAMTVAENGELLYSSFYEEADRIVDQIVKEHGITFVVSAGNEGELGNITSPGKAYNAITVGALATKSSLYPSREELLETEFDVAGYSSTFQFSNLPEKPDVTAPGSYITGVIDDEGNLLYEDAYESIVSLSGGTSFAAPLVTGVAAQIIQADPTLRFNGLAVKAIILGGADKEAVNTSYFVEGHLSREAGVGMVNSVNSVERADAQTVFGNSFNITSSGCSISSRYHNVELTAGETVRIAMTYNKIYDKIYDEFETNGYPNQLRFQLFYNEPVGDTSVRHLVATSSTYSINNVKIIEYDVATTGTYSIRVGLGPGYEKPTSGTVYQQYAVSYGYK